MQITAAAGSERTDDLAERSGNEAVNSTFLGNNAQAQSRTARRTLIEQSDKCESCFEGRRHCIPQGPGQRCNNCKKNRRLCSFVLVDRRAANRTVSNRRVANWRVAEQPVASEPHQKCRRCFTSGYRCISQGPGQDCEHCQRAGRKCNWDLTGAKKTR
jgi:hypothetical protein